ncbi:MAG: Crp/Fnr family transcriptional regulator [Actinomycetota bacterium]|nr:Crp/Fnr family transcriptional regulator [Actinomycetota bacterium]
MEKCYSSVLEALPPPARQRLWERSVMRSLDPGAFLYLAGDEAERVHLVSQGLMKLTSSDGDGRETILGLAVPGDLVGELAALDGLRQPFDVVAVTHCGVVGFDPEALIDAVTSNPGAAVELASLLAGRTRWICETAVERASGEVPARLAGRLLHLAEILGRVRGETIELDLPLGQGELGRLAGMCRESVCKTLNSFKARGYVDYRGRRLRILRPDALELIRCAGRAEAHHVGTVGAESRRRVPPGGAHRGNFSEKKLPNF